MANLKFIQIGEALGANLLNAVWVIIGLISIYAAVKNILDKENPSRIGTGIFWGSFGIVCAFGTWLPAKLSGVLVIIMCIPPILKRVKVGHVDTQTKEHTLEQYKKVGMKIFFPAVCVGIFSLLFAFFSNISSMVAVTLGV